MPCPAFVKSTHGWYCVRDATRRIGDATKPNWPHGSERTRGNYGIRNNNPIRSDFNGNLPYDRFGVFRLRNVVSGILFEHLFRYFMIELKRPFSFHLIIAIASAIDVWRISFFFFCELSAKTEILKTTLRQNRFGKRNW